MCWNFLRALFILKFPFHHRRKNVKGKVKQIKKAATATTTTTNAAAASASAPTRLTVKVVVVKIFSFNLYSDL